MNRDNADSAVQISHLEHDAVFHYGLDPAYITHVLSRIAINQDDISQLAGSD